MVSGLSGAHVSLAWNVSPATEGDVRTVGPNGVVMTVNGVHVRIRANVSGAKSVTAASAVFRPAMTRVGGAYARMGMELTTNSVTNAAGSFAARVVIGVRAKATSTTRVHRLDAVSPMVSVCD